MLNKYIILEYIKDSELKKIGYLYDLYGQLSIYKEYGLLTEIEIQPVSNFFFIPDGLKYVSKLRFNVISNLKQFILYIEQNPHTSPKSLYKNMDVYAKLLKCISGKTFDSLPYPLLAHDR